MELELLCGRCAQDKGLPLDERMELAKSRLPNTIYNCPVCEQEHSTNGIEGKPTPLEPTEEIGEKTTKNRKETKVEDQLSLF